MRKNKLVPFGLLAPGTIWLILFFIVPMYFMGEMALRSGSLASGGFAFTWEWSNFPDALEGRGDQILRTIYYSGAASLFALLIAYPLAYAIAIKIPPRWRLLFLFAVIAPFFTTYLIRTIAWKTILSDSSPLVDMLQVIGVVPDDGRVLATPAAVIAGLTYNFLPFMILPIYASLEQLDQRLIEAAKDLYSSATHRLPEGDPAPHGPRHRGRCAADVHPCVRRLRERGNPWRHGAGDDRQQDPIPVSDGT